MAEILKHVIEYSQSYLRVHYRRYQLLSKNGTGLLMSERAKMVVFIIHLLPGMQYANGVFILEKRCKLHRLQRMSFRLYVQYFKDTDCVFQFICCIRASFRSEMNMT